MIQAVKLLLFFILILLNSNSFGQTFTYNDAFWFVQSRNLISASPGSAYHFCLDEYTSIIGDTIIDSKVYQNVRVEYNKPSPSVDYIDLKLKEIGLTLYENSKLYYGNSADSMKLLYDFNLEVGDTFQFNYTYLGQNTFDFLTVDVVDSVEINGEFRKRIQLVGFKRDYCSLNKIEWIEGIGDSRLGLLYHNVEFEGCPLLTNATANKKRLIKENLGFDPCNFNPADYSDHLIFPNPFIDIVTIQYDKSDSPICTIQDLSGKTVFTDYLLIGNNIFELSSLSAGVYLMSFQTEDGLETKKIVKY